MSLPVDTMSACIRERTVLIRTGLPVGRLRLRAAAAADLAVVLERDASGTLKSILAEGVDLTNPEFREALRSDEEVRRAFLFLAFACVRGLIDRIRMLRPSSGRPRSPRSR